jgi:hypothetical protein
LAVSDCESMNHYPWESKFSYLWKYINKIGEINRVVSKALLSIFNIPIPKAQSIAIHYRCSDSFSHGLYRFQVYEELLNHINEKFPSIFLSNPIHILIITDASRNGNSDASRNGNSGNICWNLVGELVDMISGLSACRDAMITVHHSLPSHAYLLLHFANITICGRSTFCLMATLGSQSVYLPAGTSVMPFTEHDRLLPASYQLYHANFLKYEDVEKEYGLQQMNESVYIVKMKENNLNEKVSFV